MGKENHSTFPQPFLVDAPSRSLLHALTARCPLLWHVPFPSFTQEAQGLAQPQIQLQTIAVAHNCSGLHGTAQRNSISANAEMLSSLGKSVAAFRRGEYPEVHGKPA